MPDQTKKNEKRAVAIQDVYDVEDIAALFRIGKNSVYRLAKREDNPLPLKVMDGHYRGAIAFRDELLKWGKQNYKQVRRG